jgi:hypothetical protein
MKRQLFLLQLRREIPFLQAVPDTIFFSLDIEEFMLPSGEISQARKQLEKLLNCYIMTYKKDCFNTVVTLEQHLCAHLARAVLSPEALLCLTRYEKKYKKYQVNFVAYKKPIEIILPSESDIFFFYQKNGLV